MPLCSCTSKLFLGILSVFFWAAAAGLIFIGAWVFKSYENYEHITESYYTLVPASVLIGVGVFVFLLGVVGCVGAFREQKCLLGFFFTVLLMIVLALVAGGVLAYVYRDKVNHAINDGLWKGLNHYGNDTTKSWTEQIDFLQSNLSCCGVDNYTDWQVTAWYKSQKNDSIKYPESCCDKYSCHYGAEKDTALYTRGCHDKVVEEFKSHLALICGVAVAFIVILVLGMIFSCVLICKRRDTIPYIGLSEPSGGMRV